MMMKAIANYKRAVDEAIFVVTLAMPNNKTICLFALLPMNLNERLRTDFLFSLNKNYVQVGGPLAILLSEIRLLLSRLTTW